ncbi:MAG: heme exporter protein CcmB [Sphingomonadaceae bacterium]
MSLPLPALLWLLIRRDVSLTLARPGQWLLPTVFFLLVALLFPFALGPDQTLLARLTPGIAWTAALLASLIPVASLYAIDQADGTLDQFGVRAIAFETLALARILALWAGFLLPILVALPVAALFLGFAWDGLPLLAASIAIGSLGLAALANVAAALTVGAQGGAGLVALLIVPLAIPLLIFGSRADATGAMGLLAAATLVLAALTPFAVGATLRAARS